MSTKVERFTPPPTEDRIKIDISVEDAIILAGILNHVSGTHLDELWAGLIDAGINYWDATVRVTDGRIVVED